MKAIKYVSFLSLILLFFQSFAWSNFVRIINNSDIPLQFKFLTNVGGAHPSFGIVAAHAQSQEIKLTDSFSTACLKHGSTNCEKGNIEITQNGQAGIFDYAGISNKHSLNFLNYIKGLSPFPSAATYIDAEKDCDGPYNCIIINPDANWVLQALKWQNKIDQFEPLNKEQLISTHNSAVSSHYVNLVDTKLAYNQYITLTQQLNAGVRAFELDILRYNGEVRICHLHNAPKLEPLVCFNSKTLKSVLTEINTWLIHNPNQFILLYLDVNNNLSSTGANAVDRAFSTIMPKKVYTVADAYHLPLSAESPKYHRSLNTSSVSQAKLLAMSPKKQVIVIAKQHKGLANSPYVFTSAMVSNKQNIAILNDPAINGMYKRYQQGSCVAVNNYFFSSDKAHQSIWRLNGDRTPISVFSVGKDYVTVDRIRALQNCIINSFSMDHLVYDTNSKLLDPRLAIQVWSWAEGYPLKMKSINNKSQSYAVIDPAMNKFKNDIANPLFALCYNSVLTPNWKIVKINAIKQANNACQYIEKNWHFSVPVTPYQMAQVDAVIKQTDIIHSAILVNYSEQCHNSTCQWIANNGKPLS